MRLASMSWYTIGSSSRISTVTLGSLLHGPCSRM